MTLFPLRGKYKQKALAKNIFLSFANESLVEKELFSSEPFSARAQSKK